MSKNAFQIFISDSSQELPPLLQETTRIFQESLPEHNYTLYNKESVREFISNKIGSEALAAFDKLKPYAYKADLGRYCIAYEKGGWYADITIKLTKTLAGINPNIDFIGFVDQGGGIKPYQVPYAIQCSFFYTKPHSEIFSTAIELVIQNCKNEYYGVSPICPTGPGVLGRALAKQGLKNTHLIGNFIALTPNHKNMNNAYVLPEGEIIAIHKNAWMPKIQPGDLTSFGIEGSNNYAQMYLNKAIYKTKN